MAETSFGIWLRQKRKALDLTRQELAERAACAAITIEKIEVGERRPSKQVAEALAAALRIPAAEHDAFIAFARGHSVTPALDGAPANTPALVPNNLPRTLPVLIGRGEAISAALHALAQDGTRWVTLTGPGGVGKTTLALHAAAHIVHDPDDADAFKHGVIFVDLSPIRDSSQVAGAIGSAVATLDGDARAATSFEAVSDRLAERAMLLVLDNFEQVSEAALQVARLVQACPRVKVLVTSRVALRAEDARTIAVAPLSHATAASLFLARAREAAPQFQPNAEGAQAIDALCRKLDGLPLAIELVAARVKLMSPQVLLARLTGPQDHLRIDLVADGVSDLTSRQRTMREAIAWSYNLLSPAEQDAFRRMAVFIGGCDLRAAESVLMQHVETVHANADDPVVRWNVLSLLIDKNLLKREAVENGEPRFTMLETIRQYASEKLEATGERESVCRRHFTYFLELAETSEPQPQLHIRTGRSKSTLDHMQRDHDNLRAALDWAIEHHEINSALRLSVVMGPFWEARGFWSEGRQKLQQVLTLMSDINMPSAQTGLYAQALMQSAILAWRQSDYGTARRHFAASLTGFQECGDQMSVGSALSYLGGVSFEQGDYDSARAFYGQALDVWNALPDRPSLSCSLTRLAVASAIFNQGDLAVARQLCEEELLFHRQSGEKYSLSYALNLLGGVTLMQGDAAGARPCYEESLALRELLANKRGVAATTNELANLHAALGELETARSLHETSLRLYQNLGNRRGMASALSGLARANMLDGNLPDAVALLVAVEMSLRQLQASLDEPVRSANAHAIGHIRSHLDQASFISAWRRGEMMTLEQAIVYALAGSPTEQD